jgi:hypothetical protein
MASAIDTKK